MNLVEKFRTPWSKVGSRDFDTWHSMCSYLGAFPPSLASYFIKAFTNEGDYVMDPFSGRGTTILESRILNRNCIASDLNPIALALSNAKNHDFKQEDILRRISELEQKYDPALYQPEADAQDDAVHLIFHPRTLAQLCYLKRKLLNSKRSDDMFILGITLGILHGGERADGSSGYASIDMPNTFSMSPDYVRKFVQNNQLNRFFRPVFSILSEKTIRVFKKHSSPKQKGDVFEADAKQLSILEELKPFHAKIDLIVTSPPYLGIVNYAKQNWIRSWFLNEDPISVSNTLDDDLNLEEWIRFSKKVVSELKAFLAPEGVAVFVIGDVAKSRTSVIPLAREFVMMVKENNLFKNVWVINDVIGETDKTTRIWGDTKGSATTTDRIVFLSDINPFEKFKDQTGIELLDYAFVKASTATFMGYQ